MDSRCSPIDSVGKKLILAFSGVLSITFLSVLIATYAINKIDVTQATLTESSIPALVISSQLSKNSLAIIQNSSSMNLSNSLVELEEKKTMVLSLSDQLVSDIEKLQTLNISRDEMLEIKKSVDLLREKVLVRSNLIEKILPKMHFNREEISKMRRSVTSLSDISSLMKIDADTKLSNKLSPNNVSSNLSEVISNKEIENDIYEVSVASNLITRFAVLYKDLQSISEVANESQLLSIQQEFDHTLRMIVRTIVKLEDKILREKFAPHIGLLIELGQDTSDVFEDKSEIISMTEKLESLNEENIKILQTLNSNISKIALELEANTNLDSEALDNTIDISRNSLFLIAAAALFISLSIIWFFVYKNIVSNLTSLSVITKKLAKEDYEFEIKTEGTNEFSDIAKALDSLKELYKKRKVFTRQLAEKSQQLQRSNEDLSQFAYVASHDLQEPLRMIGSCVQLLQKKYENKLDQDANKYINYAVQGCLRMQSLIEGLLNFSRVESNKEEMQVVNTETIIEDAISDLDVIMKEKNAKIIFDSNNVPPVFAIQTQLLTVFRNIISNALKYCVDRDPEVYIRATNNMDFIKFSIKDNGIGIAEQYQQKIFIIFKRLHTREEFSGTGIGLSICKKIIERHGGEIWLDSKLGVGTTFYFTFPAVQHYHQIAEQRIAV